MSIPTSLIIVILVAAWLAVLVPMVARRREPVPETETETDGGTFRVLRRASMSMRRRPKPGRRDEMDDEYSENLQYEDDLDADELEDPEALDEELLDSDEEYADDEASVETAEQFDVGSEEDDLEVAPSAGRRRFGRRTWARSAAAGQVEAEGYGSPEVEEVSYREVEYSEVSYAAAPHRTATAERPQPYRPHPEDDVDETRLRPVPRRPGRGGYDPDAAEIARAYKYSRRRRVTVALLLAALVFSAAAYLFEPVLWSGTVVFGLLLVAYLGYLRRQVHIENDIRERRLARLQRARQIRPEYHAERADVTEAGAYAPVLTRGAVASSQVPPAGYRRGRQIVDLEDDDPSFDELEYYQPITYRRASGQ